ncbi:hypothetical protein ES332_D04G175900v1 [Gossypium tomentosum]|uniref:Uncharacterized protein n=1 Tax=Gossypium tomentosum TaxID=34277 RepID=A0A5D2LHW7_GOSTO|nr:hypothetical protein ES332_D04G175900v1 [Gossypium tomentosum]
MDENVCSIDDDETSITIGQAKPKEDRTSTQVIFVVGGEAQNRNMVNELNVEDVEYSEPVSPTAQYFNSSVLSVCILAVLDTEIPIDDSPALGLLKDVFLPISPRFSSLMVEDENGLKHWKKVEVKLEDHVSIPNFPSGLSPQSYDNHLSNYLSKIAMEQLPHNRPLWNIHIIKYPTSNATGNIIFKLHHSLGDGYSLMAALLSCNSIFRNIPKVLRSAFNSVSDFGWSLMKSSYVEDDISLIRSGNPGVEFKPVVISTMTFSLDDIKQIKTKLRVTINDVITGIIFFGTRLYMQEGRNKSNNEHSTALVLLNTRAIREYKSVKEMHKPCAEKVWGNQFAFLHISIPELTSLESLNPLDFVWKAHKLIQRQRNSGAVFLTARLLEWFKKFKGPEAAAKYIHSTIKNSSMGLSNMIGPVERMALANHPIKSLYFMVVGEPKSLSITMISYMGKLRVAFKTEKDFIDPEKLKSSIQNAFEKILKAAQDIA